VPAFPSLVRRTLEGDSIVLNVSKNAQLLVIHAISRRPDGYTKVQYTDRDQGRQYFGGPHHLRIGKERVHFRCHEPLNQLIALLIALSYGFDVLRAKDRRTYEPHLAAVTREFKRGLACDSEHGRAKESDGPIVACGSGKTRTVKRGQ
jgi:hypothetical protein